MKNQKIAQLIVNWEAVKAGLMDRAQTKQAEPYTSMAKAMGVCIEDLRTLLKEESSLAINNTIKGNDIIG